MKRTFCCQIQLELCGCEDEFEILNVCKNFDDQTYDLVECEVGNDNGTYVNLSIEANDPQLAWRQLVRTFVNHSSEEHDFSKATIITVTGENGWDDYLLLHHYDDRESLDVLPDN